MLRSLTALIIGTTLALTTHTALATQPTPIIVPLWDQVPNPSTNTPPERDDGTGRIWNVSVPTMLVYLPKNDSQKPSPAIIHCPGGSYTHLTRLVGADGFVDTFLPRGVAIVGLKYRLRPNSTDVERDSLADAQRALRLLRQNAKAWNIDPHRIGFIGVSAGGNLGLNIASHFTEGDPQAKDPLDRESARPDFVGLLSPWPDGNKITNYPINKNAPPAFIASARDDRTAPTTFAQAIADQYKIAGAKNTLWLVDTGGHGAFTIGGTGEGAKIPDHLWTWLLEIRMTP